MLKLYRVNSDFYEGMKLSHFEDESGIKIKQIYMEKSVVVVFTNGTKLCLGLDWRGNNCYLSQYKKEE